MASGSALDLVAPTDLVGPLARWNSSSIYPVQKCGQDVPHQQLRRRLSSTSARKRQASSTETRCEAVPSADCSVAPEPHLFCGRRERPTAGHEEGHVNQRSIVRHRIAPAATSYSGWSGATPGGAWPTGFNSVFGAVCPQCSKHRRVCLNSEELLNAVRAQRGTAAEPTRTLYLPIEFAHCLGDLNRRQDAVGQGEAPFPVSEISRHLALASGRRDRSAGATSECCGFWGLAGSRSSSKRKTFASSGMWHSN